MRHPVPMSTLVRMSDKRLYLSASRDGTLAWWDATSLKPVRTLKALSVARHERAGTRMPLCTAYLPSEACERATLLVGCADRSMLLYDVHSWDAALFEVKGRALLDESPLAIAHWQVHMVGMEGGGGNVGGERGYPANMARRDPPKPPPPSPPSLLLLWPPF
eukprot:2353672-Pleurochrysis_carterae.AAC.2